MFTSIENALTALSVGGVVIVVDDEDRENEGDFIASAELATPECVNFMARFGKGLICMPMSEERCAELEFPQMVGRNEDNHQTAFTVSVDHISTTTGISAQERATTARFCANPKATGKDFRKPGHMFPLAAKPGGVLERNGHTEATVDLMKLAGLAPVGLCCEIMSDDGSMMRLPELLAFSQAHNIPIISIKDLQTHRKRYDRLVNCVAITKMPTRQGEFMAHCYVNLLNGEHHVALVKGDVKTAEPVLCRVHSECLTGDAFGSMRCDCGDQLAKAMALVEKEGCGVVLYLRQEGRGIGLVNKLKAYALQDGGLDTLEADQALGFIGDLRDYTIGAQILRDLGVQSLRLLTNNPDKVYQLEDYGLTISERLPLEITPCASNTGYLNTKRDKMGHLLNHKGETL